MTEMRIVSNRKVADHTYEMILAGDTTSLKTPGQFIAIKVPDYYLRRPMSVSDWDDTSLRIFYKTVGHGTTAMTKIQDGALDVLLGRGNGFCLQDAGNRTPMLIGGGVGVPPLFALAKAFVKEGKRPVVLLGFNTANEIFLAGEFEALGCDLRIATMDGSTGTKGTVLECLQDVLAERPAKGFYVYTCGPRPMFQALYRAMEQEHMDGAFSLEERMGCAVGICMGCTVETVDGPKRVCKEGPVFRKEVLPWG